MNRHFKMIKKIGMVIFICSFAVNAWGGEVCELPPVNFKMSFLDQVVSNADKPSPADFISSTTPSDVVHGQFYAWFAYANPEVARKYYTRERVAQYAALGSTLIDEIIWLYASNNKDTDAYKVMLKWYVQLGDKEKAKIDFFTGKNKYFDEDSFDEKVDSDVDLFKGNFAERDGKKDEAFYYYRRLSSYGFQGGLVSLSLLIPQLSHGHGCINLAKYYLRLSGALDRPSWFEHAK